MKQTVSSMPGMLQFIEEKDGQPSRLIFSNDTDPIDETTSLLNLIGYNAAQSTTDGSLPLQDNPASRHQLLRSIFCSVLTDQDDRTARFEEHWGGPKSSKRKTKIMNMLRSFILRRQRNPQMENAIQCWKRDIEWIDDNLTPSRFGRLDFTNRRRSRVQATRNRSFGNHSASSFIEGLRALQKRSLFESDKPEMDSESESSSDEQESSVHASSSRPANAHDANRLETIGKVIDALAMAQEIEHWDLIHKLTQVLSDLQPSHGYTPLQIYTFGSGATEHQMVLIPKGEFTMGALEDDEDAVDREKPRHKVTLTRDFLMGKYPVTQALWESVMGSNPSKFKGANRPVEKVSWFDVVSFCNKLSQREGLEPAYTINGKNVTCNWNAKGYRLPTEAEWEYSARSGQRFKYAGSNNVDEVAWYDDNSGDETHPVGQKKPNGFGLYDMSGNVWEWVWDWYYDYSHGPVTDPYGPAVGSVRVLRGGGWNHIPSIMRASNRGSDTPAYRSGGIGFRLGLHP